MAYKTFVNGFPLNASEINNNLMNQSVATFLDASARSTAISAPVQGQVTYLTSDSTYYSYDGAAWVEMIPTPETPASSPNYIINGAFDFWQRGTTFAAANEYTADRWSLEYATAFPTQTVSKQSFTPGELEASALSGSEFYFRSVMTSVGSSTRSSVRQLIENVNTLAGQTVTISFYAKASSAVTTAETYFVQRFGSGGSSAVSVSLGGVDLTTSWSRITLTTTLPSVSGKTIGANSLLELRLDLPLIDGLTLDLWGVQLEAGSVATPFKRNANSLQGELAACQRYYVQLGANAGITTSSYQTYGSGLTTSTTNAFIMVQLPTTMRVAPTSVAFTGLGLFDVTNANVAVSALSLTENSNLTPTLGCTATGLTNGRFAQLKNRNNTSAYLAFSAEL